MTGDVGLWEWSVGKNETCKKFNLVELELNFQGAPFNRCFTGL